MRHANPVPDHGIFEDASVNPHVFLTATKETLMSIETQQHTEPEPHQKRATTRRNVLVLIGTIAATVIAVAIVASAANDDGIPVGNLSDDPAETQAFVAVEDAFGIYNSGDSTWVEIRDRGSVYELVLQQKRLEEHLLELFAATHAADAHLNVLGCESRGFGSSDIADGGPIEGYRFTCDAVRTDSFHGATGLSVDETFEWVVLGEEVVAVTSEFEYEPWVEYTSDFYGWLVREHPDVANEVTFVEWQATKIFPSAESMPTVSEYLDEFAADQK